MTKDIKLLDVVAVLIGVLALLQALFDWRLPWSPRVGGVIAVVALACLFVWVPFRLPPLRAFLKRWAMDLRTWVVFLCLTTAVSLAVAWRFCVRVSAVESDVLLRITEVASVHTTQTVQAKVIESLCATQTVQAERMAAAYATQTVQAERMAAAYATQTAQAEEMAAIYATQTAQADKIATLESITCTLTPTPTLPSTPEPPTTCTFQDFERDNGTPPGGGNYFWDAWFTTCSFTSTIAYEGNRSVRVEAHAQTNGGPEDTGGTMGINPCSSDPVDLSSATILYVWVYDTVGSNTVELKLRDSHDAVSNSVWSAMQSVYRDWTRIQWSLSDFAGVDMRQIKNLEIYEWNDGVYYFDDVGWQ